MNREGGVGERLSMRSERESKVSDLEGIFPKMAPSECGH